MHCWLECKLVKSIWKSVWRFLKKLEIELPYDSSVPLLDKYLKKIKTLIQKEPLCSIVHNSQDVETSQVPIRRWVNKAEACIEWTVIQEDEILTFLTTWLGLEGIMLSEISQMEENQHHMISLVC